MQQVSGLQWAWIAAGWALISVGLLLLLYGLLWDRARGRRRCPKCWYDLSATPGMMCPECGRKQRQERAMRRTRRRWWAVIASLLFAASGYAAILTPTIITHGWRRAIPTWAMVYFAPVGDAAWTWRTWAAWWPRDGTATDPLLLELLRRVEKRELAEWQWRVLLNRVSRALPDQTFRLVERRDRWPRGVSVQVQVGTPFPLLKHDDVAVGVRIRGSGRDWVRRSVAYEAVIENRDPVDLGPPPEGAERFEIEVEVFVGVKVIPVEDRPDLKRLDLSSAKKAWSGVVGSCGVVGSAAEILTAASSDRLDADVIASVNPWLVRHQDGRVGLRLRPLRSSPSQEVDFALGMRVQVLRDGHLAATGDVLLPMPPLGFLPHTSRTYRVWPLRWSEPPPSEEQLSREQWELLILGEPEVALADFRRTSCWVGAVKIPVTAIPINSAGWDP